MRVSSLVSVLLLLAGLPACNRKPAAEPATTVPAQTAGTPAPAAPPSEDWQISTDQAAWAPVALPSVEWGCDDCDRYFMRTVAGVPRSVTFRFASDNKARLLVNGTEVFAEFWKGTALLWFVAEAATK